MKSEYSNILIYGLGLMGASLSLALKKKGIATRVTGVVSSSKSKAKGETLGSADEILTSEEFHSAKRWEDYDFIIFGVPVDLTVKLIAQLPLDYSGVITDLGSTKNQIIHAVEDRFSGPHNYVSSHPMCGSEESGLEFANASLYEGRLCILTSPDGARAEVRSSLDTFWKRIGMETIEIPADKHDSILSYLSHSPHILSSIMADWAANQKIVKRYTDISPIPLNGGGFRDMTRIAGSNPKMWAAIFSSNQEEIYKSLLDYRDRLDIILEKLNPKNTLNPKEWEGFMETSRRSRDYILKNQDDSKKH
ncbi:prephenate dehydrogenase [Leptospira gomenensis]|uniref:prephenate dehydrogenase n=1 Tax=Leptospira gomenensis TaxID=2484974 RepID=A0A5F1YT67_9LEPT|nr:prephenate dehydrogenase [Leptospira gomenensis]TGK31740.1 prephenate dehydrogenase [Leptospira gomenensis]TGK36119.1 prephenate dehydrogenase [Leptospira gomenensis]TGK41632.1 prephenate dehydrogenase [Leptospira gomenensis]TGK61409.1 prephenate dehydrogenase [Leptospira gomenensis]